MVSHTALIKGKLNVKRKVYNRFQFDQKYRTKSDEHSLKILILSFLSNLRSLTQIWSFTKKYIPILNWITKYKLQYLKGDMFSGTVTGLIRCHEALACALLAGVSYNNGLYSCLFPVLVWMIFSSSKHSSIGINVIVCFMLHSLAAEHAGPSSESESVISKRSATIETETTEFLERSSLVLTSSFFVAIIQMLLSMGFCRFILNLISVPIIKGFQSGVVLLIILSQIKFMIGSAESVTKYSNCIGLFQDLTNGIISWCELSISLNNIVISVIALAVIVLNYTARRMLMKAKDYQLHFILFPVEFILIACIALIVHYCDLSSSILTVGVIKQDLENFEVPKHLLKVGTMLFSLIPIALVSTIMTSNVTEKTADKGTYYTNVQQEEFAVGLSNIISSFFGCFYVTPTVSRTVLQKEAGGKTQMSSLFSSVVVLLMIFVVSPYFKLIPLSLLSCLLISYSLVYFTSWSYMQKIRKTSSQDFTIWLVTMLLVFVFGTTYGFYGGVLVSIGTFVYQMNSTSYKTLGHLKNTELYVDSWKYSGAIEVSNIKIFKFYDSVSYINKDAFRKGLFKSIGLEVDDEVIDDKDNEIKNTTEKNQIIEKHTGSKSLGFTYLILDATMWSFIDSTSAREFVLISNKLDKYSIRIVLAGASSSVLETMEGCNVFSELISKELVYVTVHDAVISLQFAPKDVIIPLENNRSDNLYVKDKQKC